MNFPISNLNSRTPRAKGYAAITTIILSLIVSIAVIGGFVFFSLQEVKTNRLFTKSIEAKFVSEGGIEDGVYRLVSGKQLGSIETLKVGSGTTTIIVTIQGNQRTIRSEGKQDKLQQNLETRIDITSTGISFTYGAQVGDGGLEMENNSGIEGSVYSNGDITGNAGATITGDAFVAIGAPPVLNQSWETQNSDIPAGVQVGSNVTVIDSTGDVGSYTSMILGSDGFARISYIEGGPNYNLKFVRCANADCSTKVINTVDSAGDINEVTSIALGPDGFPRISYYHDGNDDLKFARCLDDDCAASVLTIIDATNNTGDFSSIKIGPDGFARIAYWYDTSSNVRFVRCTNADCSTTGGITTVESAGNVGEYISLAMGSDGFGRMSYYESVNVNNGALKFARCTNADCTTSVITTVDGLGEVNVGTFTSLALGSDGFARISYYDVSNEDLKFVRCTDADCVGKVITVVDGVGGTDVGQHTSLVLGSDGFARISYYDSSNGDLKFARCTDTDCTTRTLTTVDPSSSVGLYTSVALGPDGLGRISYYDSNLDNLKFVQCAAEDCPPSQLQVDVGQSFQSTVTDRIPYVELYLKKVGNPGSAMLRLIRDSSGRPSTSASNVIATSTILASNIGGSYAWVRFYFGTIPTLTANTPYWLVIDNTLDDANYYVWGGDSALGYTRGSAKRSADWTVGNWTDIAADLNFRAFMGGVDHQITNVTVNGSANGHIIDTVTVGGNANAFIFNSGTVTGNINAHLISNCTINGNAAYNSISACAVLGATTTPTVPPVDPPYLPLPISTTTIQNWKNDAASGGICIPPQCLANGDFDPSACSVSLGFKKITGNLILNASCSGGQELVITGTLWVVGNIDISNNARVRLSSTYGALSGVIIADGTIHLSNNGLFQGSGTPDSYIMFLSTSTGGGHHNSAIDLHNNATGAIFYASNGLVYLHNNVGVSELVGYKVHLENNAVLVYEIGLQNARFSTGPSGGYDFKYWREVE